MKYINKDEVIQMFESGRTITEIARHFNVTRHTIMTHCDKWGYDYGKKKYITGKWDATDLNYDLDDEAVVRLVVAIVNTAVFDYKKHYKNYQTTIVEERFFTSDWFDTLMMMCDSDISGEEIMKRIRMEIYDEKTNV